MKITRRLGAGYDSMARNSIYKDTWGFTMVLVGAYAVESYLLNGWKAYQLRVPLPTTGWKGTIDLAMKHKVTHFFADEPCSHGPERRQMVIDAAQYLNKQTVQTTLTLSESDYTPTILFKLGYHGYLKKLLALREQCYNEGGVLPFISIHTQFDKGWWSFKLFGKRIFWVYPRVQYRWMRNEIVYGFNAIWSGYSMAPDELRDIYKEAIELGLEDILLYPYKPPVPGQPYEYNEAQMLLARDTARQTGWLPGSEKWIF